LANVTHDVAFAELWRCASLLGNDCKQGHREAISCETIADAITDTLERTSHGIALKGESMRKCV